MRIVRGQFGVVVKINDLCMKLEPLRRTSLTEISVYKDLCNIEKKTEWKKMKNITHLGIPDLLYHDIIYDNNNIVSRIVLRNYGNNLLDIIKLFTLTPKTILSITLDLVRSLEYLHSNGKIHNDIKPNNIVIDSQFRAILIDYGLVTDNDIDSIVFIGSQDFSSIKSHDIYHRRTFHDDLESLSFNILYMITEELPWINKDDKVFYKKLFKSGFYNIVGNEYKDIFRFIFNSSRNTKINYLNLEQIIKSRLD